MRPREGGGGWKCVGAVRKMGGWGWEGEKGKGIFDGLLVDCRGLASGRRYGRGTAAWELLGATEAGWALLGGTRRGGAAWGVAAVCTGPEPLKQ